MKTFEELRENTDAAVKAFLAKGGKIKKLAPGKAQGYHGKDDPGQDVKGIMNKDDSKAIGTRKKVKSMGEANQTHMFDNEKDARAKAKEIGGKYVKGTGKSAGKHAAIKELSKNTLGTYVKRAVSDVDDKSYTQGQADGSGTDANYNRTLNKRRRGINKALNRLMK